MNTLSIGSAASTTVSLPLAEQRSNAPASGSALATAATKDKGAVNQLDGTAQSQSSPATTAEVESATQQVEEFLKGMAQSLLFSVDDDTGKRVVRLVDSETNQLIRQIPSEEILAIARALDRVKGLLLSQKA